MAKIVHSESGPQPLEQGKQSVSAGVTKREITGTPEPKTQKQHRNNTRAVRVKAKIVQQSQPQPEKPVSLSKKRRMRELTLETYRKAEQRDSARRANKSRQA